MLTQASLESIRHVNNSILKTESGVELLRYQHLIDRKSF